MAPAGVFFAGAALSLRDGVHERLGARWVLAAILLGAAASYWIASSFALASAVAFLCSETADFAVYTPLRERGKIAAVVLSNLVGDVVDSALFLWLAFGSLDFIEGQLLGKYYMTVPVIAGMLAWRRWKAR